MLHGLSDFFTTTGFPLLTGKILVMWAVAAALLGLATIKGAKPLLLVPLAFGVLLANLPVPGGIDGAWFDFAAHGVKHEFLLPGIFLGLGAWTDFGPLIARPRTLLLGAAVPLGVFVALLGAGLLGFTFEPGASISVIGAVAVAAYGYLCLRPLLPPALTGLSVTAPEHSLELEPLRTVSLSEKIIFGLMVVVICTLLVPAASSLVVLPVFGNLLRESTAGVRRVEGCQPLLITVLTIFLGVSVGLTMTAESFLGWTTVTVLVLGVIAFAVTTVTSMLIARLMNVRSPGAPGNSQIGAGVIGTALAAGYFLSTLGH